MTSFIHRSLSHVPIYLWLIAFLLGFFIVTLPHWPDWLYLVDVKNVLVFLPRWWFLIIAVLLFLFWKRYTRTIRFTLLVILGVALNYQDIQIKGYLNGQTQEANLIKIASINLGEGSNTEKLKLFIKYVKPDVLLLQEVRRIDIKELFDDNFYVDCQESLCIASAFPAHLVGKLTREKLNGHGSFASLYEMEFKDKKLYLANVHLNTPRNALSRLIKRNPNFSYSYELDQNRDIEASIVSNWAKGLDSNVIVAGDFNSTVNENIYQNRFSWMKNAISEYGRGLNYTKVEYWRDIPLYGLRIDHILVTPNIEVNTARTYNSIGGDHSPIVAEIKLKSVTDGI